MHETKIGRTDPEYRCAHGAGISTYCIRHFAPLAHAGLVTASNASNPLEPVALPGIV